MRQQGIISPFLEYSFVKGTRWKPEGRQAGEHANFTSEETTVPKGVSIVEAQLSAEARSVTDHNLSVAKQLFM